MTLAFWSWISFWTTTKVVIVIYQTPSIKTRGTRTCWNCKKKYGYTRSNLHICYICKTQIHVQPQICVLSSNRSLPTNLCPIKLLYHQIHVLLPRRSVSFGFASHSNLCPPKSIFPQICVLYFGRKNDVIIISVGDIFWD